MSYPSLIDGQTNEQTGAMVLLLACVLAGCWVQRCGDERVCPAVLHNRAAGQNAQVWEEMRRRGRSNGCEWAPGRAAGGQRVAGSSGG